MSTFFICSMLTTQWRRDFRIFPHVHSFPSCTQFINEKRNTLRTTRYQLEILSFRMQVRNSRNFSALQGSKSHFSHDLAMFEYNNNLLIRMTRHGLQSDSKLESKEFAAIFFFFFYGHRHHLRVSALAPITRLQLLLADVSDNPTLQFENQTVAQLLNVYISPI